GADQGRSRSRRHRRLTAPRPSPLRPFATHRQNPPFILGPLPLSAPMDLSVPSTPASRRSGAPLRARGRLPVIIQQAVVDKSGIWVVAAPCVRCQRWLCRLRFALLSCHSLPFSSPSGH